jgi:PleD family two-component response regulator
MTGQERAERHREEDEVVADPPRPKRLSSSRARGWRRRSSSTDRRRSREPVDRLLPHTAPIEVTLRGVTVLAVDDDEDAMTLLREALESAGATAVSARSAAGALHLVEAEPPHVLSATSACRRSTAINSSSA